METTAARLQTWQDLLISRRKLLRQFGWSGLALFAMGSLVATCRMFLPRTVFEPPSRFKAGVPDDFTPGTVSVRFQEKHGVWIVRRPDGSFLALKTECPHLGCTPEWLASQQKFKCPCHGSGFRMGGTNFEGPAPRPLDRVKIALAADGQLVVDKGVTYPGVPGQDSDSLYPQSLLSASGWHSEVPEPTESRVDLPAGERAGVGGAI